MIKFLFSLNDFSVIEDGLVVQKKKLILFTNTNLENLYGPKRSMKENVSNEDKIIVSRDTVQKVSTQQFNHNGSAVQNSIEKGFKKTKKIRQKFQNGLYRAKKTIPKKSDSEYSESEYSESEVTESEEIQIIPKTFQTQTDNDDYSKKDDKSNPPKISNSLICKSQIKKRDYKDLKKTALFFKKHGPGADSVFKKGDKSHSFIVADFTKYEIAQYDKRFTALKGKDSCYNQVHLSSSRLEFTKESIQLASEIFSSARNYVLSFSSTNLKDGIYTVELLKGKNEFGIVVLLRLRVEKDHIPGAYVSVLKSTPEGQSRKYFHFFEEGAFEVEFRFDNRLRRHFLKPESKSKYVDKVDSYIFRSTDIYHIEKSNLPVDYRAQKFPEGQGYRLQFPDAKFVFQRKRLGKVLAILRFCFQDVPGSSISSCGVLGTGVRTMRAFIDLEYVTKNKIIQCSRIHRNYFNENASEEYFKKKEIS